MKKLSMIIAVAVLAALMVGLLPGCTAGGGGGGGKWIPTKPIELIVDKNPGASYDTYARVVAPYIKKYLGVDVLVKNVVGSGGIQGFLQVWNGPKDGSQIMQMDLERFVSYEIFANTKPDWSMDKWQWIGEPARGYYVLACASKLPWKTMKDVVEASKIKPVRMVGTDVGTTAEITRMVTGMQETWVMTTGGGSEMFAALARGDGDLVDVTTAMTLPFIKSGDARAIMLYADKQYQPYLDEGVQCQTAVEAGYPELAALFGPRAWAYPPGTPENIVNTVREAFAAAVKDPECIAKGKEVKAPIIPGTPKDLTDAVTALRALYNNPKYYPELKKSQAE